MCKVWQLNTKMPKLQQRSPQCLRTKTDKMLKWKLKTTLVSFLTWKWFISLKDVPLKLNWAPYSKVWGCLHPSFFENHQIWDWKSGLHIIMHIAMQYFLAQQLSAKCKYSVRTPLSNIWPSFDIFTILQTVSLWIILHSV